MVVVLFFLFVFNTKVTDPFYERHVLGFSPQRFTNQMSQWINPEFNKTYYYVGAEIAQLVVCWARCPA